MGEKLLRIFALSSSMVLFPPLRTGMAWPSAPAMLVVMGALLICDSLYNLGNALVKVGNFIKY